MDIGEDVKTAFIIPSILDLKKITRIHSGVSLMSENSIEIIIR